MRIDEENFIHHLKCRDEKALEYVIDNYIGLIKSITGKHLGNLEQMQEECIDDILLAIWYGIESFDESRSSFKNWIAGIAKFKSIDYQRQYYKKIVEKTVDTVEINSDITLEDEVLINEIDEKLEKLLMELKPDERKLFMDYYLNDKDIVKIAEERKVRMSAIYNKLSRTRNKLRVRYKSILVGGK